MKCTLFSKDGKIIACVTCAEEDILLNVKINDASGYILGEVSNTGEWYVSNNELVAIPKPMNAFGSFNYQTKQWDYDLELAWASVRSIRTTLLAESDWTQIPDVPLSNKPEWDSYRQLLRDITLQEDPLNIHWPNKP